MRAAILAGGASRRFGGVPKGLSSVGGKRILDLVADDLRSVTENEPIIVLGNEDQLRWAPPYEPVIDTIPGKGTLGGIFTAVTAGPGPVLVAAWDMPFLSRELLVRLCAEIRGFDAYLPGSGNRRGVEPLCAVYDQGCVPAIRDQLDSNDLRAIGFHSQIRVGILSPGEVLKYGNPERLFFNVNSGDDLKLAEEMWLRRE